MNVIIYRSNQLEGTIDFSVLPSTLTDLRLYQNNFHGNINNFGHLRNLYNWWVDDNNLNGTVDWSQFRKLTNMYDIRFQNNDLTGDIDLSYVPFENLQGTLGSFTWQNNLFDGTINLGNMTSSVHEVSFEDNPDIKDGVDFSSIVSTSTSYPRILLDTTVYCKTDVYCSDVSCALPQDRNTNDCSGKIECENTCGECVACSTTTSWPTIMPSSIPTRSPATVLPTNVPSMNPISMYLSTTLVPLSDTRLINHTKELLETSTTEEGLVDGATNNSNGLSDSQITLLIIGCIATVLLIIIICGACCALCLTIYLKHKERMKSQEMTQITRPVGLSLKPAVGKRTLGSRALQLQQNQIGMGSGIGIGSQSDLNISSEMILANTNSPSKMGMQHVQHTMGDANTAVAVAVAKSLSDDVDTADIGNVDAGNLQTGEIDSSINDSVNDMYKQNKVTSNKSGTHVGKDKDNNNDSDDTDGGDDNVEIRYKQVSSTEMKKNIVDSLGSDDEQLKQSNSGSNEGLYCD